MNNQRAFSFTGMLIALTIFAAVVLAVAMSGAETASRLKTTECSQQRGKINVAIAQYVKATNAEPEAPISPADLGIYLASDLRDPWVCPANGTISIKNGLVYCSIHMPADDEHIACRQNLRLILKAAAEYSAAQGIRIGQGVSIAGLVNLGYLEVMPQCPGNGTYSIDRIGNAPYCSVHKILTLPPVDNIKLLAE